MAKPKLDANLIFNKANVKCPYTVSVPDRNTRIVVVYCTFLNTRTRKPFTQRLALPFFTGIVSKSTHWDLNNQNFQKIFFQEGSGFFCLKNLS